MKKRFFQVWPILPMGAGFTLVIYYLVRVYYFLVISSTFVDRMFAILLLLGETYMIIHALGFVVNILRLSGKQIKLKIRKPRGNSWPTVAVLLVVRHEPKRVVEQTVITLKSLDYPHMNIYILDGSSKEKFLTQDRLLAQIFGISFFHPDQLQGAKAGTINAFLANMKEEYLAVFDADQNPMPDFLKRVVSIAEADEKIAFVQTPQFYSNIGTSPIAKGAAMQQSIFYEGICEAKNQVNAMFCCGTNVLFRREALMSVGGFDMTSITEDFSTSVKLHMKGYRSIYDSHVRVFGMAPESLPAYLQQQARWAAGTCSVLSHLFRYLIFSPGKMSWSQWGEYFLAGSYYFVGWAFFFLMMCPILFLTFRIPSFFVHPIVYLVTFLPYFLLTLFLFYGAMKKRNYSLVEVYHGIILGSLSFPILLISTVQGLFGQRLAFTVTPKGKRDRLTHVQLIPWYCMIFLNVFAIALGLMEFSQAPYAIGVNIVWCVYHLFILSHIFRFNAMPRQTRFILPNAST